MEKSNSLQSSQALFNDQVAYINTHIQRLAVSTRGEQKS